MARTLIANVFVGGVLYGPAGETPTPEVAALIVNPKVWAGDDEPAEPSEPDEPDEPKTPAARAKRATKPAE